MLKKLFLLFVFLLLLPVAACADVSLSSFPDPVLHRIMSGYDSGWSVQDSSGEWHTIGANDGVLSDQELRRITWLHLGSSVKSIQGTESLTYLEGLNWECGDLGSTELNVSNNKKLTHLSCDGCGLTSLNVSGCTALERLYCYNNQLTTLDVSSCTALEYLHCGNNQLTALDVSGCTALRELYCFNNQLTELDVSSCTALRELDCSNNQLTALDVSGCTALRELYCGNNQLTTLDVSSCTALEYLSCGGNQLTELDVSSCTALERLYCGGNQLTELDVSSCTALEDLICHNNQLTELDLSACTSLQYYVYCNNQKRSGLKVKKTSKGYEVNMKDYVSHLENIKADSISPTPKSYNSGTGVIVFSEPIIYLRYDYMTHSPNNKLMDVTLVSSLGVVALERGNSHYLIGDMTDNSYLDILGEPLTEGRISLFSYSDYGKLGFTADGNSRLILRVQTSKPGTVSFSGYDEIGATLESLANRTKSSSFTVETKIDNGYQFSAVLVAPEKFPAKKKFPSDKFTVHVKFTDEDGKTTEEDVELKIEAAPVVLIHGLWGAAATTFGSEKKPGVWHQLKQNKFDVETWDYDGKLSPAEVVGKDRNDLFKKLTELFNKYNEKGIVCTKADIVAFGMGGLMAEKYLDDERKDSDDGNNWTVRSYRQGMVRRLITIATPHRGTRWADLITSAPGAVLSTVDKMKNPLDLPLRLLLNTLIAGNNAFLESQSGLRELRTDAARNYVFPAGVPMYAIYGDISGWEDKVLEDAFRDFALETVAGVSIATAAAAAVVPAALFAVISIPALATVAPALITFAPAMIAAITGASLAIEVKGALELLAAEAVTVFKTAMFDGDGHDLVVSVNSVAGGFGSASDGYNYLHWSLPKRDEVGARIVSLLRGTSENFTTFGVGNNASNFSVKSVENSVNVSAKQDSAESFKFIKALNLKSYVDNSGTVTFSVTTQDPTSYDIFCTVCGDKTFKLFKIPAVKGTEQIFKVQIPFTSEDMEGANVFCFSHNPGDNKGTSLLISDAVQISLTAPEEISPSITTSKLTTAVRKKSYSLQLKASGTAPIIWTHTGDLPAGLKLSASGKLSGTPTKAGSYTFTVKAENAAGASSETFTLKVTQTKISGTVPETATRKSSFTAALKASSGTSPYTWSISDGKLPNGLNINTETGAITGLPTKAGTYTFTVKAKDKNGVAATKSYTVKITQPAISGTLADSTLKASYSKTLKVSGGAEAYTWAVSSGELPTGLKLTYSGTKATISGTPTTAGTYTFKIKVTDANKATATQSFTVKITKPAISGTLADGIVKAKYSKTLTVSCGVAPYKWTVSSGTLPNGLKLTYSDSKATISGKPTKAGTFTFKIKATDANKATAAKSFTVNITQPEIAGTFANGKLKAKYSKAVTVSGGTEAYTWSMTGGTLPTGLKLTYSGAKAKLSGTPTSSGTFTFTLKVTDANKATATQSFTVKITKPTISGTLPDGTVKTKYSATLKVSGGTASYTWVKASGTLPNGLKLTSSNTKATISGTPTKAGTFTFKIKVTDANGATKSKSFTVKIAEASASGKESTNEKGSSSEKATEKSQSEKNQDETQSSQPENSPELPDGEDTDVNLYAELKVMSEDVVEAYDGKDSDLVKVKADTPLRFTVGDWGTEVDDVAVYVDDKALGSVQVSDEGRFTLPAEVVTGDFKVGVKATSTAGKNLESEEIFIITE